MEPMKVYHLILLLVIAGLLAFGLSTLTVAEARLQHFIASYDAAASAVDSSQQ
jgi:hypothetical protein